MFAYIRRLLNNKKGFTLIELMIVVVILGILAAVAVPQFATKADDAKVSATKASLAVFKNAIQLYHASEAAGGWPADLAALKTANYLTSYEANDPWGFAWQYDSTTGIVKSFGKDKASGGTGFNADIE